MRCCTIIVLVLLWLTGLARGQLFMWRDEHGTLQVTNQPAGDPAPVPPAVASNSSWGGQPQTASATLPAVEPARDELRRRESTLASREAHLELLRTSSTNVSAEQLRLENILQDEIAADRAAIAVLRGGTAEASE